MLEELKFLIERIARFINKIRSKGLDFKKRDLIYLLRKNITIKRPNEKLNFKKLELFKIKKKLRLVIFKL